MADIAIADQVCHAVRQLGLSKERTRRIVDGVRKDLANNGPEWVMDRVKSLRDYYVDPDTTPFPGWISYRRKACDITYHALDSDSVYSVRIPKGWMGLLVSRHNVETTIALTMTIVNAMVYSTPTDKQLEKWHSNGTNPPEPSPREEVEHLTLLRKYIPQRLSKSLERKLQGRSFFGPSDIHGTRIPTSYGFLKVRVKNGKPTSSDLYRAWADSIMSAPVSAWEQYWSLVPKSGDKVDGEVERLRAEMRHLAPDTKRPRRNAANSKGLSKRARSKKALSKSRGVGIAYVGDISFLQKPGGKLRTVANPNRFVQWLMEPLGEALSDIVNSLPGVYVTDQEAGRCQIQKWLSDNVPLTSMDLSSASDTLDYSQVLAPIISSEHSSVRLRNHLRYFSQLSQGVWRVTDPKAREVYGETFTFKQGQPLGLRPSFPLLTLTNYVAALVAWINVDTTQVQRQNVRDTIGHVPWVIVGDDIVMPTRYATAYAEAIRDMGGLINLEKSRTSEGDRKYAEFCSRLITSRTVLRLKPRMVLDDGPENLLTYQNTDLKVRVKPWERRYASYVGSFALAESGAIPLWHGDQPRPLPDKLLTLVTKTLKGQGLIPEFDASMETLFLQDQAAKPPYRTVTGSTHPGPPRAAGRKGLVNLEAKDQVSYFTQHNPDVDLIQLMASVNWFGSEYWRKADRRYIHQYRSLGGSHLSSDEEILAEHHQTVMRHLLPMDLQMMKDFLILVATDPAVRSQLPAVRYPVSFEVPDAALQLPHSVQKVRVHSEYDHDSDSYVVPSSSDTRLVRLQREISQIERDTVHDGERSHLIAAVSDNVDMLVEDIGEGRYSVDFYSPNEQRHSHVVDALAFTRKTERRPETAHGNIADVLRNAREASGDEVPRTPIEVPEDWDDTSEASSPDFSR